MDQFFLIDQEQIAELPRIAELIRAERPDDARALEEIARCARSNRVIDDTCY